MKLIICDVEGTIFQPHMIKDARHASYIWTVIAEFLGKEAEQQEIDTQKKWYKWRLWSTQQRTGLYQVGK